VEIDPTKTKTKPERNGTSREALPLDTKPKKTKPKNRTMKKRNITLFTAFAAAAAFASSAQAATIIDSSGFTATASHTNQGTATVAVDGTGMTGEGATGMHSGSDGNSAWFGAFDGSQIANAWFKVDLGATYDVGTMYVWNGQPGNGVWDRGSDPVDMYYSTVATTDAIPTGGASSGDWILITGAQGLNPKADASVAYLPTDALDLNVTAQSIGLYLTQGFGGNGGNSLSELQFFEAPPPPSHRPTRRAPGASFLDYLPNYVTLHVGRAM
jgi:hypothetical protein